MARTLNEITQTIKAVFMANQTLVEAYGLDSTKTFDEQFSAVSIETAIITVIAFAHYLLEKMIASFRTEINERIESARLCSIPWYREKALEFQYGHSLMFNNSTYDFGYAEIDEDARIIRHVAVRQLEATVTKLQIYTNLEGKTALPRSQHEAFQAYMRQIGAAGTHYEFISKNPDRLRLTLQVIYKPLLLNSAGQNRSDGTFPVREAINEYIDAISFGGTLNRTELIDAIQAVEGVSDIVLTKVEHAQSSGSFITVLGQNVNSSSGSFIIEDMFDNYTTVV